MSLRRTENIVSQSTSGSLGKQSAVSQMLLITSLITAQGWYGYYSWNDGNSLLGSNKNRDLTSATGPAAGTHTEGSNKSLTFLCFRGRKQYLFGLEAKKAHAEVSALASLIPVDVRLVTRSACTNDILTGHCPFHHRMENKGSQTPQSSYQTPLKIQPRITTKNSKIQQNPVLWQGPAFHVEFCNGIEGDIE